MVMIMVFNIINFAIFLIYYSKFYFTKLILEELSREIFLCIGIMAIISFILSTLFYSLCSGLDPGYIKPHFDIVELLQIANDKNIDLENFCLYCRVIKSNKTFHCTFCKRCVEKFDHHCTYINNCLGYRNHKYFIGLILALFIYYITSLIICIASYFKGQQSMYTGIDTIIFCWICPLYTTVIDAFLFIPLIIQIREQVRRIFH